MPQPTMKESKSATTIRRRRSKARHSGVTPKGERELSEPWLNDEENAMSENIDGPPWLKLIMSSNWLLFLGLLAFRIVNALVIQTSFVPDEFWQSLEVAHRMAFGYGYMTWEWHNGLRGYTYPLAFAAIFKLLGVCHLDNRILLIKLPRLIQAVFAAAADLYLYRFARRISNVKVARWTLVCLLTSWFTFYTATRTLSNSIETSLSTIALYYFPWPGTRRLSHWKYLVLVGLAVLTRPTAAIMWISLCLWHALYYRRHILSIILMGILVTIPLVSLTLVIDRLCYGAWVNVAFNFLNFNVVSGLGTFYGSHPWHWYISQGFPAIMFVHLVPFVASLTQKTTYTYTNSMLLITCCWTIFVYSLLGHKEFRFIFPILPVALYFCALFLHSVTGEDTEQESHSSLNGGTNACNENSKSHVDSRQTSTNNASVQLSAKPSGHKFRMKAKTVLLLLIGLNLPVILYTSLIHQRGTVDVMGFIHDESKYATSYNPMSVLFLMPCHSTPFYSYVHKNITMRFLTCEPNLDHQAHYLDEADLFYLDPTDWLYKEIFTEEYYPKSLPSHLVMFNVLQPAISELVHKFGYRDCKKLFHSHMSEGRVGSHVLVMCLDKWMEGRAIAKRTRAFLHMGL